MRICARNEFYVDAVLFLRLRVLMHTLKKVLGYTIFVFKISHLAGNHRVVRHQMVHPHNLQDHLMVSLYP